MRDPLVCTSGIPHTSTVACTMLVGLVQGPNSEQGEGNLCGVSSI